MGHHVPAAGISIAEAPGIGDITASGDGGGQGGGLTQRRRTVVGRGEAGNGLIGKNPIVHKGIGTTLGIITIGLERDNITVHMNHDKGALCTGVSHAPSVSSIQLPNAIYFDGTVVVRVTANVGNNTFVPQQLPEAITMLLVLIQAVSYVTFPSIVSIGLRIRGLMAENKDVRLVCGVQVANQPVIQVIGHITVCGRGASDIAILVQHHKVRVLIVE